MTHYKGCDISTYTYLFKVLKSAYKNRNNKKLIISQEKWLNISDQNGVYSKIIVKVNCNCSSSWARYSTDLERYDLVGAPALGAIDIGRF